MRRVALAAALALVTGCSLPLPSGVRGTDGVQAEPLSDGDVLQVQPPGPQTGQSPSQVVTGFLQAQANADDRHAIARSFLTPAAAEAWDDAVQVQVYDLGTQRIRAAASEKGPGEQVTVTVAAQVTGLIGSDGRYSPQDVTTTEEYRLDRVEGQWRLSSVPSGLRLTAADRARSYPPYTVFHVADTGDDARRRLVPERLFLASGPGLAQRLVERSLHRPSGALADTVVDHSDLTLRSVSTDSAGVVRVDVGPDAQALSPVGRAGLSAQLVWSLRELGTTFSGLRLLSDGQPLLVPGEDDVQDDQAWSAYDPSGFGGAPPSLYVSRRKLVASPGVALVDRGAVDEVALSPDGGQVALVEGAEGAVRSLRSGPTQAPELPVVLPRVRLASPSYGSGWRGLWFVRDRREIALLPFSGRTPVVVPVTGGLPVGPVTALAVSRDGARIAVVIGERLYVGIVAGPTGAPRVAELTALLPGAVVTDAGWLSGTELALVGHVGGGAAQLLRLTIDGSGLDTLNTAGRAPEQLAASPGGIVFTSGGAVYSYTGRIPTRLGTGSAPAYPG